MLANNPRSGRIYIASIIVLAKFALQTHFVKNCQTHVLNLRISISLLPDDRYYYALAWSLWIKVVYPCHISYHWHYMRTSIRLVLEITLGLNLIIAKEEFIRWPLLLPFSLIILDKGSVFLPHTRHKSLVVKVHVLDCFLRSVTPLVVVSVGSNLRLNLFMAEEEFITVTLFQ